MFVPKTYQWESTLGRFAALRRLSLLGADEIPSYQVSLYRHAGARKAGT